MKQKHVILRVVGPSGREFLGGPLAGPSSTAAKGLAVDFDTMDRSGVSALAGQRDVVAVAPVMPMKLIEPVSTPGARPAAAGMDWGIQAVGADSTPFSGDGVVVAVLDTGIDSTHPAFSGVTLVRQNFTGEADGSDKHGHGTHCAGTIFGRDTDGVRIGVARGVKKALIGKVLGATGGGSDQIAKAIQWAVTEGANVISMSLGMDFPGYQRQMVEEGFPQELATSRALEDYRMNVALFERLAALIRSVSSFRQAVILVAAAGNESQRDVHPDFEISVTPPAVSEGIISVAALDKGPTGYVVAPFSNTGVLISGPGVGITSAKRGGGLTVMSGTSMAAPHVAGVAALWAQKLSAQGQVNAVILSSKLVASGETSGLQAGFDPADVGSGMVRAPQD